MSSNERGQKNRYEQFYPQDTFPILPTQHFTIIPKVDTKKYGREFDRGQCSELAAMALLSQPELSSWVSSPRYVGKDEEFDSAGIDVLFDLRSDSPAGEIISRIAGFSSCRAQVKSSDHKVEQFIRDRIKGDRNGTRGLYVLNGTHPREFMVADMILQMLIHSGKLFDAQAVHDFISALDDNVALCVSCPFILDPIMRSRSLLLRRFYPDFDSQDLSHLADLFIDVV